LLRSFACLDLTVCHPLPPLYVLLYSLLFLCHHTASAELYTLSLHDALPICCRGSAAWAFARASRVAGEPMRNVISYSSTQSSAVPGSNSGMATTDPPA